MIKTDRAGRLAAITAELTENPGRMYSLNYFSQRFGTAKSTISEDLTAISRALEENNTGEVRTYPGAAGGVSYLPAIHPQRDKRMLEQLARELAAPQRRLPGGFLFYSDLLFNPAVTAPLGRVFAALFAPLEPTQVLTLETKGIPLALFTAHSLNCPLLIARRTNRVTEGPAVSTNYLTGSARRIETMFLPRRSLARGSRVLVIDDFMKAGGAALGLSQLVKEFEANVVGTGVLIATRAPASKLVADYSSLLELVACDETGTVIKVLWRAELD